MSESKPSPLTPALLAEAAKVCERYTRANAAWQANINAMTDEWRNELIHATHALGELARTLLPALVERELGRQSKPVEYGIQARRRQPDAEWQDSYLYDMEKSRDAVFANLDHRHLEFRRVNRTTFDEVLPESTP